MAGIKLSIVMPCYNVEATIGRALDSILMQRVDFPYEILVVDDGSTDGTRNVVSRYAARDQRLKLLVNPANEGNAKAFKKGAEASRGRYLCVLDGDDFYTVRDKLQKQADFLDGDREGKYAAVAHKYLTVYPDGAIGQDARLFAQPREYSYLQFINGEFYCHTSTMMLRNVFRNLEIPILETQRGDTIRTFIAMSASGGRVKVLNFVGSAYTVNPAGIWSSLDAARRKEINVAAWQSCRRHAESALEKRILGEMVSRLQGEEPGSGERPVWSIGQLLANLADDWANAIAFRERDFIFRKLYISAFLDSFCESLGFIRKSLWGMGSPGEVDARRVAIIISALNKRGGRIYQEIVELVSMLGSRSIAILLTDVAGVEQMDDDALRDFAVFKNVSFVFLKDARDKAGELIRAIAELAPAKIYWYCGHNNTWADAALQHYGGRNILPFSFDHGFSLGLANTNIDVIIAKTPKDYKLLSERFGDRVIYIPCWSAAAQTSGPYRPLANHDKLNTATAAARFYKYQGSILGSFPYFLVHLLKATGGRHAHFGPLPPEIKGSIHRALERNNIDSDRFTHIEWADNLPDAMLARETDIFIAPFPVSSIKLNLQCISAGIPVLVYAGGLTRIEQNDFLNPDVLRWRSREEFFATVKGLDRRRLQELSESGKRHFFSHNDLAIVMPHVLWDQCFPAVPIPPHFIDSAITDADEILDLLGIHCA